MDFSAVEGERRHLLNALTQRLGREDLAELLNDSLAYRTDRGIELRYKPVTILDYPPQARVY
jgi:hypothetical protein